MANEIIINGKSHRYSWLNTIFIQVDDFDLIRKITDLAQELDCDLEIGREDFPDLMAVPFFIGIVDRRVVGPTMWEEVLGFRSEFGGNKPLIVVDIENGVDAVKTKNVVYTDSHHQILDIIINKKKWLNRVEFIYYNRVYKWVRWKSLYLSDAWDRLLGRDQ